MSCFCRVRLRSRESTLFPYTTLFRSVCVKRLGRSCPSTPVLDTSTATTTVQSGCVFVVEAFVLWRRSPRRTPDCRTPGLDIRCLAQAPLQRHSAFVPDRPPRLHRVFKGYDPPL